MTEEKCLSKLQPEAEALLELRDCQSQQSLGLTCKWQMPLTIRTLSRLQMAGHGLETEGRQSKDPRWLRVGYKSTYTGMLPALVLASENSENAWAMRASLSAELAMLIIHEVCWLIRCKFRQ